MSYRGLYGVAGNTVAEGADEGELMVASAKKFGGKPWKTEEYAQ